VWGYESVNIIVQMVRVTMYATRDLGMVLGVRIRVYQHNSSDGKGHYVCDQRSRLGVRCGDTSLST
jgi:hypothetical protein